MILRDYQQRAVDSVYERFAEGHASTLLVLPTGMGKTVCFAHVAKRSHEIATPSGGARVLVLAHREELIAQAAEKIERITGERPDIERAESHADIGMFRRAHVVVASKDSLHEKRLQRFNSDQFALVITDEAHHAVADSYRSIYRHFNQSRHLGVTATPDRTDEEALGQVFQSTAMVYELTDAIENGWLTPIVQRVVHVHDLDYSEVRTTAGDLNARDVADVMANETVLHQIVSATLAEARWRRALVFAPPGYKSEGVDSFRVSQRMTEIFNRHAAGCAMLVTGETPKDERRQVLKDFAESRFQFLVNVGVFTEGFDDPGIDLIVMARATKSRSLYAQMIGRGTRPLPGIVDGVQFPDARREAIARSAKPNVEVLDFEGNAGRHKLVTSVDVLGGKFSDEVVEKARVRAKNEKQPVDMTAVLADEAAKAQRQREQQAAERRAIIGKAKYSVEVSNPFDVLNIEPPTVRGWDYRQTATAKQRELLERWGVKCPEDMLRVDASRLLDEMFSRRERGLATFKQCRILAKRGIDTAKLTFAEASQLITDISAREGWKKREVAA